MSSVQMGLPKLTIADLAALSDRSMASLSRLASKVDFHVDEAELKNQGLNKELLMLNALNDPPLVTKIIELNAYRSITDLDVQRTMVVKKSILESTINAFIEKHSMRLLLEEIAITYHQKLTLQEARLHLRLLRAWASEDRFMRQQEAYELAVIHAKETLDELKKASHLASLQALDTHVERLNDSLNDIRKNQDTLLNLSTKSMMETLKDFTLSDSTNPFDEVDSETRFSFLKEYQIKNYKYRSKFEALEKEEKTIETRISTLLEAINERETQIKKDIKSSLMYKAQKGLSKATLGIFDSRIKSIDERAEKVSEKIKQMEGTTRSRYETSIAYLHSNSMNLQRQLNKDKVLSQLKAELQTLKEQKLAVQVKKERYVKKLGSLVTTLAGQFKITKLASALDIDIKNFTNKVKDFRKSYRDERRNISLAKNEMKQQIDTATKEKARLSTLVEEPGFRPSKPPR